jgi:hypothetical protein
LLFFRHENSLDSFSIGRKWGWDNKKQARA